MSLRCLINRISLISTSFPRISTIPELSATAFFRFNVPVRRFSETKPIEAESESGSEPAEAGDEQDDSGSGLVLIKRGVKVPIIPVETSIRYLKSSAYQKTYGSDPVWKLYRRNHKGSFAPLKTRKTCIRKGVISTGNPCPICRDEYLVLGPENVDLLKQFISSETGGVISYSKTGICQKKHTSLLKAISEAKDRGLITFDVPYRDYDYSEYTLNTK